MEEMLAEVTGGGPAFRLCHSFDYLDGTSTGAIIARDADGKRIPLNQDLDRRFLYARYNADLSREGLDAMDLNDIQPKNVQKLDSIEYIDDLRRVGRKVAQKIKIEHFGNFTS